MIEDPELRRMLEEEAKVVRREHDQLSVDDRETLIVKRKLKNRYEEIERLLGPGLPGSRATERGQRIFQYLTLGVATGVVLIAALFASLHVRVSRFEENLRRHQESEHGYAETEKKQDELLRQHEQTMRRYEELLRWYETTIQKSAQ